MKPIKQYGRFFILLLFITLITTVANLRADIIRQAISGVMPADSDVSGGAALSFKISPDGQYTVFVADIDSDDTFDLYSVPVDGSAPPTRLSNVLNGTSIIKFVIDSQDRIVYTAEEDNAGVTELYRVNNDGSGKVKINPEFVDGALLLLDRDVGYFQVSPDGGDIVYRADHDTDDVFELYSVKIAGTNSKLNDPLIAGGDVVDFKITLDGSRVIYQADQDISTQFELYTVLIGGGAVDKLNFPLVAGGDVAQFELSTDYVIYRADEAVDTKFELYRVPIADGTRTKMNADMASDAQDVFDNFKIYVDGSDSGNDYLIYRADQDVNDVNELYSVNLPNSATRTKLNDTLPVGGDVDSFHYKITPDGSRVVYLADQTVDDVLEMYVVPIGGGVSIKRNDPLATDGDVSSFAISSDSGRIVYIADQEIDEVFELYSVAIVALGGPIVVKLNDDLIAGGDVLGFSISPSKLGYRVLYRADGLVDGQIDLFSTPLGGGIVQQVNGTLVAGGTVFEFSITPDNGAVLYNADQNSDNQFELFSVSETLSSVQFINSSITVVEQDGSVELDVTLSAVSLTETSVKYVVTGGTATNGVDYDLAAGTLTFPAGNTFQTIFVSITDDALAEANETIIISLSAPGNATIGGNDTITVTISDEYTLYLPTVTR